MWEAPMVLQKVFHSPEVNWLPLSVVTVAGQPYRASQCSVKASSTSRVATFSSCAASTHLVVLSIMVRICVLPLEEGNGPTMSKWTCEKRRDGTRIGTSAARVCLVTLARAHPWQSLHHAAMSRFIS